ncbi:hypothetical protein ACIRVF_20440 [Kitasatospora sp. NPDC101157]|uniref:hypothetical protein n=1 Tax=Kitasatospora sp. NPDC101157 TaxID=3364098 RepID=UPI0038067D8C
MADYFPYRIVTRRGDFTLVWRPGEGEDPDALMVDEGGRLLAFEELAPLREHCERNGWEVTWEGEGTLDLRPVRRWVEHPELGPVAEGRLLDAWNFFEDLAHSVRSGPRPPAQGTIHDSAYEKAFGGEPLDPAAGGEAWTDEETAAVRHLLRAGLALWAHAVHGAGTSSGTGSGTGGSTVVHAAPGSTAGQVPESAGPPPRWRGSAPGRDPGTAVPARDTGGPGWRCHFGE